MFDMAVVGARLRSLRKTHDLTQGELATKLGVTAAAVSNWEKGKDLSIDRVFQIATALSEPVDKLLVDFDQVEHNENIGVANIKPLRGRVVPRYTLAQAVMIDRSAPYDDQVRSHFPCSENSFALIISDRANADRFLPGDSVIIDPDIAPEPEDMVFAYVGAERRPVFRSYELRDHAHYTLRALNQSYPSFPIGPDDEAQIIGVMSEHTSPRRT